MDRFEEQDCFNCGIPVPAERISYGALVRYDDHQAALDEVLVEAVWAMEKVKLETECVALENIGLGREAPTIRYALAQNKDYCRASKFLASPLVAEWRKRQEEDGS